MGHLGHSVRACLFAATLAATLALSGCGGGGGTQSLTTQTIITTISAPTQPALPGTGRPEVTIGDKNFTEQFVLGELYYLALKAQGYSVTINRNIGPLEVSQQALQTGSLSMYPEYISTWDTQVAGDRRHFRSMISAYRAAQRYALAHGLTLLNPTPFSDTEALAVQFNYGVANRLSSVRDLRKVASRLTLGAPLQFQTDPAGLPAIARAYDVRPAAFKALDVGAQYQALDSGAVQAADVNTTDGQLITGNYTLLSDPRKVFGWGNAAPVVPLKVIQAEGPQFAATINRVSALLTLGTIRQLNAAVDVDNQDPAAVAAQFLVAHGLMAPATP
jgi:osmoprotectant transport system substrate-binding protein